MPDTTVTVDTSKLNWQMVRLEQAVGTEFGPQVVQQEVKGFVTSMERQPPNDVDKAQKNVDKAMRRGVKPLDARTAISLLGKRDSRLAKRLEKLGIYVNNVTEAPLTPTQQAAVLAIIQNMQKKGGALTQWRQIAAAQIHSTIVEQQNIWGNVPKGLPYFTTDVFAWEGNLAAEQLAVGVLKSGWNAAANATGVPVEDYVSKHGQKWGTYEFGAGENGATATLTNNGVKLPTYEATVDRVLAGRQVAMATKLRALLAGRAVNLGFMKVAGESWTRSTPTGG